MSFNKDILPDQEHEREHELEFYSDGSISSDDARFPRWLILTYIILPIWGFCSWYYFFNGSHSHTDPIYWNQLQRAALTTFPDKVQESKGVNRDQDAIIQWKEQNNRKNFRD